MSENRLGVKACGSGCIDEKKSLRVINIGLSRFYEALTAQNAKATQIEWRPPVKQNKEISDLLDLFM